MECPHCGVAVVIAKLREHQERACVNQERPCKNWTQGCKETGRPLTATWHECADHLLRPRSCLSLPGPCAARAAYVAVDEADLEAPWTAEFWIRRAPVEQPGGLLEGRARKAFRADALRRRLDDAVLASQGKAQEIERELAAFFAQPDAGGMTHDQVKAHQEELMGRILAATEAETDRRVEASVARYTAKVLARKLARAVADVGATPGALERTFAPLLEASRAAAPPRPRGPPPARRRRRPARRRRSTTTCRANPAPPARTCGRRSRPCSRRSTRSPRGTSSSSSSRTARRTRTRSASSCGA